MDRLDPRAVCVLCLVATLAVVPLLGAVLVTATPTGTPDGGVTNVSNSSNSSNVSNSSNSSNVSIVGPGVIDTNRSATTDGNSTLPGSSSQVSLWQSEPFTAHANFTHAPGIDRYRVCGYANVNGTRTNLGCEHETIPDGSVETANLSGLSWPANGSGTQRLSIELQSARDPNRTLDNQTVPVVVLTKQGDTDADADGLTNADEFKLGLDPLNADMDEDGLADGAEINDYGTSPRAADTDGDGVRDGEEVQVGTDPTVADSDGDGLADDTELAIGTDPTSRQTPEHLAMSAVAALYLGASTIVLRRRRDDSDDSDDDQGRALAEGVPRAALNDALGAEAAASEPRGEPVFVTDADQVRHLLDRHGGRMKQSAIVEATSWSKAKVSRLLSAMDDDEEIEKLSLGRENLISLDREWIDTSTSPDDADAEAGTETDASASPADSPETAPDGAGGTGTRQARGDS